MENKYLVIDHTNGQGYSSPTINVLSDFQSASELYAQHIGQSVISNLVLVEKGWFDQVKFVAFEDGEGEDSYATMFVEASSGEVYVLNCDFATELKKAESSTLQDIIDEFGIAAEIDSEEDISVEEDSHEACITHVDDQVTGTHYVIIQIK